jgi:serine/threonine protein kinase
MASAAATGPGRLPDIDLRPYGIQMILDDKITGDIFEKMLVEDINTNEIYFSSDMKSVRIRNNYSNTETEYDIIKVIGAGTFGAISECANVETCKPVAIKVIRFLPKNGPIEFQSHNFLKECIIQIILSSVSKQLGFPNGGVPEIYSVGFYYDASGLNGIIVSELMKNTLRAYIEGKDEETNDIIIPDMLLQISNILHFFGDTLQFNHRDLKDDNIMYTKIGDKMIYKLIDFGFSCLQWNQLQIKTSLQFPEERPCFKEGRDLAQLIYYLIYFQRDGYKFSARLNEWMRKRLFVNYAGSRVSLSNWISTPREIPWPSTYRFFNRNSVRFLASNPQQIRNSIHALPFVMGPAGPAAAASGSAVSGAASFLVPVAASGPAASAAAASAASASAASAASNVDQRKYTRSRKHKKVSKIIKSRKRRVTHK